MGRGQAKIHHIKLEKEDSPCQNSIGKVRELTYLTVLHYPF